MSVTTEAVALDTVRRHLSGITGGRPQRHAITGLHTPLGDTITVTVGDRPPASPGHLDARLTIAEMNRGDDDADLAIVVDPSGVVGIDTDAPEAWNVHMTLPTLLRLLGQDTTPTTEGTPE